MPNIGELVENTLSDNQLRSAVSVAVARIDQIDSFWTTSEEDGVSRSDSDKGKRKAYWILPDEKDKRSFFAVLVDHDMEMSSTDLILSKVGRQKSTTYVLTVKPAQVVLQNNLPGRNDDTERIIVDTLARGKKVSLEKMINEVVPGIIGGTFMYESYKESVVIDRE